MIKPNYIAQFWDLYDAELEKPSSRYMKAQLVVICRPVLERILLNLIKYNDQKSKKDR